MEKTEAFLSRIGMAGARVTLSLDFLARVQEQFVLSVPYENLDILDGKPISLDADDIYEKIVTRGRGGYCFELNALLHHMLERMGFEVRSCFARFLRGEREIPFRRHRIVVVTLDGADYMMDVGVGQVAPRFPLRLEAGLEQAQNGELYRFARDVSLGWVLSDFHCGEWRRYISFTEEVQYEADFAPTSFWCEKHPESPFNRAPMIAIKTARGRKTVNGTIYKIFEGEICVHEEELDEARINDILAREFALRRDK